MMAFANVVVYSYIYLIDPKVSQLVREGGMPWVVATQLEIVLYTLPPLTVETLPLEEGRELFIQVCTHVQLITHVGTRV